MQKIPRDLGIFENLLRQRGVFLGCHEGVDRQIIDTYTGQYAVLILDSSGFTRITAQQGVIHFLSLIVDLRDRLVPLFKQHNAETHWHEADNIYAIFSSAEDAVQCAIAMQRAVRDANNSRPPESNLEICIGIGFGRMLYIGERHIYGQEMNYASKLGEDIAGPGEILLTDSVVKSIPDLSQQLNLEKVETDISGVTLSYFRILGSGSE